MSETRCPTCGPQPGGPGSTPLNETDKNCFKCGRTDLERPNGFDVEVAKAREALEAFGKTPATSWDSFAKVVERVNAGMEADRKRKSAKLCASAYSSDADEIEAELRSWE